ncbi:hypothetical protein [Azovibrio restrictus]|uniref:hypothetical protein n=1 Tax=Azovibrio restrictus TaxID=146938 RepID=UPI0026EA220F|nr:hypothetical protein [Azovibrio restrictus]MDD3484597.1 hypothetical protein [Azovibrio restrictus]
MDRSEYTFYQARLQGAGKPPGLLARALRLLVVLIVLVLGFMFSLVAFAILAVGGALAWAYFWWKTRKLRQKLQEQGYTGPTEAPGAFRERVTEGEVIEGEVIGREHPEADSRK